MEVNEIPSQCVKRKALKAAGIPLNEITKEKLDIGFIHKNLKEGEKVEVYYLPHLKIGSIYKIQQ